MRMGSSPELTPAFCLRHNRFEGEHLCTSRRDPIFDFRHRRLSTGVRSDYSSSPASSKDDSCACFGIGKDLVRVQPKPEVPANVGKTGGADIPQSPGELHRADEANLRPRDLRRLAARFKNPAVKPNVMGSDELRANEQLLDSRPQFFERRLFTNMFPRNAVYGGKEERVSGGPN